MKKDNLKDFTYKSLAGVALEIGVVGGCIGMLNYFVENELIDELGALLGGLGIAALSFGVGYGYLKTVLAKPYAKLINDELAK